MGKDLKMEAFASCEEVKPVILHVYELHAQNVEKNRFSIIRGAAGKLKITIMLEYLRMENIYIRQIGLKRIYLMQILQLNILEKKSFLFLKTEEYIVTLLNT